MEASIIQSFLSQVENHVHEANWEKNIKIDYPGGDYFNVVTPYVKFSMTKFKNHSINNWTNKSNYQYQNSMQIYVFLRGSLTADSLTKAIIQADEYTRIGTPDGTTFLRVIISI